MEAQVLYAEEVKAISEDVEVAIIHAADHVKEVLAVIDSGIREAKVVLTNNELLLASDADKILGMWSELDAVCQHRTDEIEQFAAGLEEIEQARIRRIRGRLQRLTYVLMETAHALPPEVERIIEAEAYEVNTVVISNRRVFADLVARLETANVDIFLDARLAWERGQTRWRHLRHDEAIASFQATLHSPLFTDPEERRLVLEQIRVFQEKLHIEQRLAVLQQLKEAGASLTSDQVTRILEELSCTQQIEEENNQFFLSELKQLDESKGDAAKALREALRLELHGFGSMAKEGAIQEAKAALVMLLSDDSMEDLFRAAGGLKTELDTLAKQLNTADLIYNTNLEPVVSSVGVLLSALPLTNVMEKQGKEAGRKAVQSTLEKVRKATKGEIMSLLPSLQSQISMLTNLEGMGDKFQAELGDISVQLNTILRENGSVQGTGASIPAPISMNPTSSVPQCSGNAVDLQAIRKMQRRLGMLLYASELDVPWQEHLHFIAEQLELQTNANRIVDEIISRECDPQIDTRQQKGRILVDEMGKRMEQQSAQLYDHVEKLAKFFLRVVRCLEESVDKVQYVNLSVMDLLDTLDEDTLADLETKFTQSCTRLRHSPTTNVLREEFQRSSDLLLLIEGEYRTYDKRVSLAAGNNVAAIATQRLLYLERLCDLFGLKQLHQTKSDEVLNVDHFLSAQHIEEMLKPISQEKGKQETFRTASGLELVVVLSLANLAHNILAQPLEPSVLEKVQAEFLVLNVPSDTVESLLASFRDAILSKYHTDAAKNDTQTKETRDDRQASFSMLLKERLRVHWPRNGRLDVQLYQPRVGELLNHQQRQERLLRGVWLKMDEQQVAFATKVEEALVHIEQTRMAQIGFQAQLPLQQSLAALQGLEVKAKKRLGVFKGEAMEILAVLRAMTASDIDSLLSSCQDYVRACSSQLFPDLMSSEIISGCDYHPGEITAIREKLATIEAQARDQISEREKQIDEISSKQSQNMDIWETFKARSQTCMQSLAMKEGLGQKFGLPRRTDQERYRSEMTRCEARSATINTLLASLDSLLRAKIYHRGMYFGFLRNPSQLELKPAEFDPATGRQDEVIRDHEVVDEEDRILAVPFLEFADQVSAKCQEETKALYEQEGKNEELPPVYLPAALEEYLSSQMEKARSFVLQQEVSYREQAKQEIRRKISDIFFAFEPLYQSWMDLKTHHTLELRPHLCSPNNGHLLQELEKREKVRSTSTQSALDDIRSLFLADHIQISLSFEARLIRLSHCLMLFLDSSVLSLDDVKPFSGEKLLKRKSLKRLRKVARVKEFGYSHEVKRTAAELQILTQSGEVPRFPLRSWAGIPFFGLQSLWEEVKADIQAKDLARQCYGSDVQTDFSIQNLTCVPLASNDGACVALLTPAHRALIQARDTSYADYITFCREEIRRCLDNLHERMDDEVKWTRGWEKGILRMRQSTSQLA
ncbi:uncharacterized protein PITG_20628 [Phytophthora infestans T30-4]|uniref:DUF4455 domain-containing protein n=1 Tax=Phytophthora infestans (strain T30-4) TaxID=403677 RepID=D0P2B5_PHYIT|nr:uncharacterized protein PITG_20628 [Phytophthora infestans T30-4]EEY55870.1 conserved hypothetical protein [Phytophthora infestans T30-4]|eukprot:XP_002895555.1 conserved hypothetical protein [Phytophthora infestans T30-4]